MKKTYHLCLSSHDEVMFRSEYDLIRGFNALALACYETGSTLLAEAFLPSHFHCLVQTEDPLVLSAKVRYGYSRYFNFKYKRRGRLGEEKFFILEVDGFYHKLAATNYVLRQGLHHGVTPTPFAYPHSSSCSFFTKDLGKKTPAPQLGHSQQYKHLPKRVKLPDGWRMEESGLIFREDVLDVSQVESLYISPRNYLYHMNRIGDESGLLNEQSEEKSDSPLITAELIERGIPAFDLEKVLTGENNKYNPKKITDLELCEIIDGKYLTIYYPGKTLYEISASERLNLSRILRSELWDNYHKTYFNYQMNRCFVI